MTCPFCDGVAERIVASNESAFAFPSLAPIVEGHILVCPRRHVKYYEELSDEEKKGIEELRLKIKGALKRVFKAEGFNYAWNEEMIGGQSVPHFHLHILPRKEGDAGVYGYEPRAFLYRPNARSLSSEENLATVISALRSVL